MNRSLLIGLVAGAGAATALGAVANYARVASGPATEPVTADVRGPVQRDGVATAPADAPAVANVANVADAPASARFAGAPPDTNAAPARRAAAVGRATAPRPAYARVVHVEPVTQPVAEERQVCREVPVVAQAPVRDERRVVGTIAGAVIGGILGHQIGGGDGRRIATVAGAAAGGYAGNRIQDRMQRADTVTTTESRCETVYDSRPRTVAYDVTYAYEGRTRTVRMTHAPGERLPVRDGRVVTTSARS